MTYRVLVLVEERTRRHDGAKPVAMSASQIEGRVVLVTSHRRQPLRSFASSRFRSGNARRTRTLHTNDIDNDILILMRIDDKIGIRGFNLRQICYHLSFELCTHIIYVYILRYDSEIISLSLFYFFHK